MECLSYAPRTLVCLSCGNEYTRRLNRPGTCGPCQYAKQQARSNSTGAFRAAGAVNYAIRTGRIASPRTLKCVDCGLTADRYDHRDYNRPLDVQPVCGSCNNRRGHAIPRVQEGSLNGNAA